MLNHRKRRGVASDLGLDDILAKISAVTGSRRTEGGVAGVSGQGGMFSPQQASSHQPYMSSAVPKRDDSYPHNNVRIQTLRVCRWLA
jgi:hypothetical protein